MTIIDSLKSFLLVGSVFLSSCAYMQTHKNIQENYQEHTGYRLTPQLELYRAGGHYYLAAEKQQLRLHYPVIHDSIFLSGNNEPTLEKVNSDTVKVYRRISDGTAQVLQLQDGYATLPVLSDEIKNSSSPWLPALPAGAHRCTTQATVEGNPETWKEGEATREAPFSIRLLSKADQVLVDWPGTILYNVAIPIMAPFVFFHEFLNDK